MNKKYENVIDIIENEKEIFKSLKDNNSKDIQEILIKYPKLNELNDLILEYSGFLNAFKELQEEKSKFENNLIPGKFLFKLHDTYGLNDDIIEQIAEIENLKLDLSGLQYEIMNAKQKSKKLSQNLNNSNNNWQINDEIIEFTLNCPKTNDNFKYSYKFDENKNIYNVQKIEGKILGIFENGKSVEKIDNVINDKKIIGIITDKSNFYYESGGQESDRGIIKIIKNNGNEIQFNVDEIEKINDCIIHIGKCSPIDYQENFQINLNDNVNLIVDEYHRTYNTFHHTGNFVF